jgi:hypothetical protein
MSFFLLFIFSIHYDENHKFALIGKVCQVAPACAIFGKLPLGSILALSDTSRVTA